MKFYGRHSVLSKYPYYLQKLLLYTMFLLGRGVGAGGGGTEKFPKLSPTHRWLFVGAGGCGCGAMMGVGRGVGKGGGERLLLKF